MSINTVQKITLDLYRDKYVVIQAKQYDHDSRYINVNLTSNGQPFLLNEKHLVQLKTYTSDKRALLDSVNINGDGTCTFEIDEAMTSNFGVNNCELIIYSVEKSKRIATMNFKLDIRQSVYDDDKIISSDQFDALSDLIVKATDNYNYVIKEAGDKAKLSESWAVGGTGVRDDEDENNSKYWATLSNVSETNAKESEINAKNSEINAKQSETISDTNASITIINTEEAKTSASNAKISEMNAKQSENQSKSYAVGNTGTRSGEDEDNALYYYQETKSMYSSLSNALIAMGTITFEELPLISSVKDGYMYNISNEFITSTDFKDGGGKLMPSGTNVYKTADGYWDCLAGSTVSGIKGNSESSYRQGNVNISLADIVVQSDIISDSEIENLFLD